MKKDTVPVGFEDVDSAREYLARYLLSYINIELEGLPEEEWGKTLTTWVKMCAFAKGLIRKGEEERDELYGRFRFDPVMRGIMEDLRKTFVGMLRLGLVKEGEPPYMLLVKAIELVGGDEELLRKWELSPKVIKFAREFLRTKINL